MGIDVVGVIFAEEIAWRKSGDSWLFLIRTRKDRPGFRPGMHWPAYFVRAGRAGRSDLGTRIPELSALVRRKVALVGLGCLGAPSAIELARTGVEELRFMDDDIVEPGTVVRWPLGLASTGKGKVESLASFIGENYPYTQVKGFPARLGSVPGLEGADLQQVDRFLDGADLVYDATAEVGIHYLLSELARERQIPYIGVSATTGGWGGRVIRFRPGVTEGCWVCLQLGIEDGRLPVPPAEQGGEFQPPGCADPTFAGAGFDIASVALAGVRLVAATLCGNGKNGYPDFGWDLGVLALRDENGGVIAPSWRTYPIEKHPECKNHQA